MRRLAGVCGAGYDERFEPLPPLPPMRTDVLDYDLPPDRIATRPVEPRDAARLLVADRATGQVSHHHVRDLPALGLFEPGDLVVMNRTRVIPAAFEATRRDTGGRVRGLYLHAPDAQHWRALLEARGRLQPGERLTLDERAALTLIEPVERGEWLLRYEGDESTEALLHRIGQPPLPPYIRKSRRARHEDEVQPDDVQRYNTVYAQEPGSVAAPTAGLHFTPQLLDALARMGVRCATVTLHVSRGTFEPVRSDTLQQHRMHEEWVHVPRATIAALRETRAANRRILAVGTTTVRALESLPEPIDAIAGDHTAATNLFIHPEANFTFRFTDRLLTNFHLPRSTLLAMVATLPGVGLDRLKTWYRSAIDEGYRFYSYGDAMLIA
ncbi:MAG: tRNA preQ1(34) S-adenosylmethionine ribosyltransferase-isomerase QueA [Phycisphaeraceae bacterium]